MASPADVNSNRVTTITNATNENHVNSVCESLNSSIAIDVLCCSNQTNKTKNSVDVFRTQMHTFRGVDCEFGDRKADITASSGLDLIRSFHCASACVNGTRARSERTLTHSELVLYCQRLADI